MIEPDQGAGLPSPNPVTTAAERIPFGEMKDQLLIFGAFGLLVLVVIFVGQGWPPVLQSILVLVIFLATIGGYVFLRTRGSSQPSLGQVSELPHTPPSVPFDDQTRLRLLRKVDFAKKYRQRLADPDYKELKEQYDDLDRAATELSEACGVKWWEPSRSDTRQIDNEDAATYLLSLIEVLFFFQDDTGRWDDLVKWSAWGYMLSSARKEWGRAVVFAQRVAWVWHRRDKIEEMRHWVNKLSIAAHKALEVSVDKRLKARLEHAVGRLELLDGHIDKAAYHLQNALSLYQETDLCGVWETCCDLAQLETRRLSHVKAEHYLDEAMRVVEKVGWDTGRVECYYYYWLLYEDQALHDASFQTKAEEAFTNLLQSQDGVQTAYMESRVRYEIALQELQRGELLNAYLMARKALSIEDTLQTASWPLVRQKTIEMADLLYEELLQLNKDESA